ncbi:SipW-dependent-type signal peptide-containing protein [Halalkalirubrum salinum]|uniref:SipW-dependent-type signal peptide-containing protein n=1 Tax=Halalkalirubrum salinum TaxID=2563889 RepID=UPI001F0E6076|nr:SipW-dependent-type signal peptide-containing protein [Halalkalirubrum salinum]
MTSGKYGLSRRKLLGGLGAIGVASTGAGLGTSAYFSDEESFEDNSLEAGQLDLNVDWEEHYNYPQLYGFDNPTEGLDVRRSEPGDDEDYVGLPNPTDPLLWIHKDDLGDYMTNTAIEAFPDPNDDGRQEIVGDAFEHDVFDPCRDGADLPEDLEPDSNGIGRTDNADTNSDGERHPLVHLDDVKPGDFGELTLSYHICDNPGYVWLTGELVDEDGGTLTEPEEAVDSDNTANLADYVQTVWWYDDGDNVFNRTDCEGVLYMTNHSANDPSTLYKVELAVDNGIATATTDKLVDLGDNDKNADDLDFAKTHIAASTDGATIYAVAESGEGLARYDTDNGDLEYVPIDSDEALNKITQAAVDTDGRLWIGSHNDDTLFEIADPDADTVEVTDQFDLDIDIEGADNVFASSGQLYLYTNADNALYTVNLLTGDVIEVAELETGEDLTGLAISESGRGNFVASVTENTEIIEFDLDGTVQERYEFDGDLTDHTYGDLTTGALCEQEFTVGDGGTLGDDLDALEDGVQLDDLGIKECFQPGFTRYIGFAWWIPRDVENEIQGDSLSFDVGFYTEQCRHNDDPSGPSSD